MDALLGKGETAPKTGKAFLESLDLKPEFAPPSMVFASDEAPNDVEEHLKNQANGKHAPPKRQLRSPASSATSPQEPTAAISTGYMRVSPTNQSRRRHKQLTGMRISPEQLCRPLWSV